MYKKSIIIILWLALKGGIALAQPLNCHPFKEGRYQINDTRIGGIIIAERKGGYQTESIETLKVVVKFKISWQSDCSYTLTLDKVIRNENKINLPAGMIVNVKIIAGNNTSSYTQEASSSLTNGTYRSEVRKL